jgi:hypothetical protein
MLVQDFLVLGRFFYHGHDKQYDSSPYFYRPGALIAGTWAVMQHMGTE